MLSIIKSNKASNNLAFIVLGVAIFFSAGTYGAKAIVNGLGMGDLQERASLMIYLIWALVLIKFLIIHFNYAFKIILYELVYLGVMYINYRLFPMTRDYYLEYEMNLRQIVVVFIPSMAIAANIKDFDGFIEKLRPIAIIGSVFMIFSFAMGYSDLVGEQFFGVQISPFALILLANYLLYKRVTDLLFTVIVFFFILLGGRQSLISVLVGFCFLYYSIYIKKISLNKIVKYSIILIPTILFLYLLFPFIIDLISNILSAFGYESRTISMLKGSELMDTSTREVIYDAATNYIQDNLFTIQGLFGDRSNIRSEFSYIVYPHNMVLELMMDFGFVYGGIISLAFFILFFYSLIKCYQGKKMILSVIGSIVICRLTVSSSFMIEGLFYFLLGLLISNNSKVILKK